ncbi:PGAP1-like protein-domain-containing protein [Emericellopsis atlantica]|uniref:GPI inositol-deacylase n=1 Tax=Emericellopsis atlantica TaxID=2614577 RepID=A0A9P8CS88_9HYPO|nr:PGAP1-like protein-domain-containing protein [Emericellopsis atlantica]KAG9257548.1 PGAP1-like protein-domain-containing protein [Emericellopsis atlantica]
MKPRPPATAAGTAATPSPNTTDGKGVRVSRSSSTAESNGSVKASGKQSNGSTETLPALLDRPSSSHNKATKAIHNDRRSSWSISLLSLALASLGIGLLLAIVNSLVTRQFDPKGCRMSYMRPSYIPFPDFDTEHTRFATKYSLYLYREQGVDDSDKLRGAPVLFIPGNAGSYKQVRPIAAEAANYFKQYVVTDGLSIDAGVRNLDFFTVDFNEDITAFHGQTLWDQAEYLNEAVRYILALYSDPQRVVRDAHQPEPSSVIILGHSMGGIVARTMLVQPNYQPDSINTIITMSAPHARAPVSFDGQIVQIYDQINGFWRNAFTQKSIGQNPLKDVTLLSIAGGNLDTIVPSDYASVDSLVPETHGFTVFTTGIPTVWTSMDHQAILWCDQFRKVVAHSLLDIVDVRRGSQTKPREERMKVFRKRFLTGLESPNTATPQTREPTTLLRFNDDSTEVLSPGHRLVLSKLGGHTKGKAHVIPVPPQGSPQSKRFTLLTDQMLNGGTVDELDVLLCRVSDYMPGSLPMIDLAKGTSRATTLACRPTAGDVSLLPPSTSSSRHPFTRDGEAKKDPFSYVQYDIENLVDDQFIAVVDRKTSTANNFLIAELSDYSDFHQKHEIDLMQLLRQGIMAVLPANRPMVTEVEIPSMTSSLLAYRLHLKQDACLGKPALFAPLVRQYIEQPYESRFFVNAQDVDVSLHGVAPYLPPSLKPREGKGVTFQFWTDPSCKTSLQITLAVDPFASLGKLYMRYRTVFAAFPLLIVTLVLRKQFRVYDLTGTFVSFAESLDLSLRRSIPLLVLSMTMLSVSVGTAVGAGRFLSLKDLLSRTPVPIDFQKNDLLIGTSDPFYWFLVPLIGIVCLGVCVILHYAALGLTHTLAGIWYLVGLVPAFGPTPAAQSSYAPTTPRRRMITTIALLLLVSFLIPYQFAYLVACLVQLCAVVRALRTTRHCPSTANTNYYNYAHSVLLLMLWVLPINLPILAVWIRNLAVHWLTPFSSHHNILSIAPFILLVENLTSGKMVPQLKGGLRHVTSILLFATAVAAAIYGVSHAYMLHHLVNIIALWLVIVHATGDSWSLTGVGAIFDGNASEGRQVKKTP